jgi:hypothetical protein
LHLVTVEFLVYFLLAQRNLIFRELSVNLIPFLRLNELLFMVAILRINIKGLSPFHMTIFLQERILKLLK